MYSLTIKVPVYKIAVHVRFAPEIHKTINSFAKRKSWKDIAIAEGAEVHGLAVSTRNCTDYYIFYDTESVTVNYLIHEISHVIDYIFDEKEIEGEGEARAYLIGHISEKIFDYVLKKDLLINKYIPKKEKPIIINTQEDEEPSGLL